MNTAQILASIASTLTGQAMPLSWSEVHNCRPLPEINAESFDFVAENGTRIYSRVTHYTYTNSPADAVPAFAFLVYSPSERTEVFCQTLQEATDAGREYYGAETFIETAFLA